MAVRTFFTELNDFLPKFVSIIPSHQIACAIALVVLAMSVPWIQDLRTRVRHEAGLRQHAWIAVSLVALSACAVLEYSLFRVVYSLHSLRVNRAHFTLCHWVGEYARALRAA